MKNYEIVILEKRVCRMIYTVKARSLAEAKEKAEAGETLKEEEIQIVEVVDRQCE